MFRSLNFRLLLSYVAIVLVCLALVGLGLLLFVRSSPLWTRAATQRLEEAERATMHALLQAGQQQALTRERFHTLLAHAAEENDVRVLLLDDTGKIRFDTEDEWLRRDFSAMAQIRPPFPPRLQGVFTSPDGQRWAFVGNVLPGDGRQRQVLVFTSHPTRLLLLVWFASNLLPPLAQAGAVALVLSVLLALLISRSVGAPLRRVAGAAESIARGEIGARAPVSGPTEVRGLARSFNTMADQVEAAQRSQRDFVANVSHELKTPLTSIQGFSQALLDGAAATPAAKARAARVIHEEANRMRRMVDELLTLARFDAGQMVLARDPVELGPLLQRCVEKLSPQARAADAVLELNVTGRLRVTGDGDRLAQVFANLLDNSLAHTPAGGKVTVAAQLAEKQIVEVVVTDTGAGIPADALSRIFERFYQVDKSRGRSRGACPERNVGAGLGLAITKEIVEAHGGAITAESVMGLGSKFTVRLPVYAQET
ncbi:MAG: ATP-binding protein [Chloroflexota bacterium]|nr:ATP-binding protein [Chloroflexota bacterium]